VVIDLEKALKEILKTLKSIDDRLRKIERSINTYRRGTAKEETE